MATIYGGYLFIKQHLDGGFPDGGAVTILCDSLVGVERVRRFLANVMQAEPGVQKSLDLYDEVHWSHVKKLSLLSKYERLAKKLVIHVVEDESQLSSVEIEPEKDYVHIFFFEKSFRRSR
jgi:hypothetical protein